MSTAVISCCYALPVFQSTKHVFDLMPLFIQGFAVPGGKVSSLSRWDAWRNSLDCQGSAKFVAVVTFVADQTRSTAGQSGIDQLGTDMITHLAFTQAQDYRATLAITNRM